MQNDPRRDPSNHQDEIPDDGQPRKDAEIEINNSMKLIPKDIAILKDLKKLLKFV